MMAEIEHVLYTCCDIKRSVVEEDERDTGERMLLNFGHTLGHAYELAGHYETWTHGQAVAAGMVQAAELGVTLGVTPAELPEPAAAGCWPPWTCPRRIPCTAGRLRRRHRPGQEGGWGQHHRHPAGGAGPGRAPQDAQGGALPWRN